MVKGNLNLLKNTLVCLTIISCLLLSGCDFFKKTIEPGLSDIKIDSRCDLIQTLVSPTGEYTLNAYNIGGGATSADSCLCEITYPDGTRKNIYWEYPQIYDIKIEWIDDEVVSIDGRELNVLTDTYCWRTK